MVAGKLFNAERLALNYDEVRQVALAHYPKTRSMGVTAVFN